MAKLKMKVRLAYMPGPWGLNEPVKGASVKIIDKDASAGGDDVILSRTSNSLGKVVGTSKDWQDSKRVKYWEPLPLPGRWKYKTVPDPTDLMLLEIDVKDGDEHMRVPFVFLGDNVEVPVVVPWGKVPPPGAPAAALKVNGVGCDDAMDLQKKARAAIEGGSTPLKIEIRGPEAVPFVPFADKSLNNLKEMVDDIMPGAKQFFYSNPTGAEELIAIALIILAVGAAVSVTVLASAVAFALILAILFGYCNITLNVLNSDAQNPLPGIEFVLKKC